MLEPKRSQNRELHKEPMFQTTCQPLSNDLATIAQGYYEGESEITYADSNKETIFKILDFFIRSDF